MSFRRFSGRGIGGVLLRRQGNTYHQQAVIPDWKAAEKVEQFQVGIPVDREEVSIFASNLS